MTDLIKGHLYSVEFNRPSIVFYVVVPDKSGERIVEKAREFLLDYLNERYPSLEEQNARDAVTRGVQQIQYIGPVVIDTKVLDI